MNVETYIIDCRNGRSLSLLSGITLRFRLDCDGYINVFDSHDEATYIYLTNYDELISESVTWIKGTYNSSDKRSTALKIKGLQFDVTVDEGIIFDSRTYTSNSLRMGNYHKD